MKQKQIIALVSATALVATALAGCGKTSEENTQKTAVGEAEGTAKEDLPFSKYAEPVKVHLGGSMNPNAKIPDGMSYEDNSYTRLLKKDLNIDVVYDWVTSSSDFEEKMNLCIGSGAIPDLMNVNATQYRALLKYDMIQPLDQYFDDYASDTLKGYVESGGDKLKECITNDKGEIMAIPAPSMMVGEMNEMWIRQDWLDKLGLEVPRTWDEMAAVAEAFVTQDPDGNGEDDTIGILGPGNSDHLNATVANQFGLDPLFSSCQSYPQYWLQDEDGTVKYGSIQPETRTALEKIQKLYKDKLIDPEMFVRNDCKEPLLAGKVGIFFNAWWGGYTVADATLAGEADWRAYFTPLAEDGNYYTHMPNPTNKYVVASKNCKNPEAAFKIVNYLIANEQQWVDDGISSTEMGTSDFYPLYNGYDNADEIEVSTETLEKYLAGEITMDDVNAYMATLSPEESAQMQAMTSGMSDDQILQLFSASLKARTTDATLDSNKSKLGITDLDTPSQIDIYATDFDSKEKVQNIIKDYNKLQQDDGKEENVINYTDYVGIMMSSVSTIINAISYVLIAFVAISLIVSSIMIGIITYISVLERTKEIGVLRSIGASKKDVSRIFNAETLIEGFVSGALGIVVTLLLCIPANALIKHLTDISNVAQLPVAGGVILIIISMFLTFIAGLIPAKLAAKKDPVVALRSE